jgi:hypothetical protein
VEKAAPRREPDAIVKAGGTGWNTKQWLRKGEIDLDQLYIYPEVDINV